MYIRSEIYHIHGVDGVGSCGDSWPRCSSWMRPISSVCPERSKHYFTSFSSSLTDRGGWRGGTTFRFQKKTTQTSLGIYFPLYPNDFPCFFLSFPLHFFSFFSIYPFYFGSLLPSPPLYPCSRSKFNIQISPLPELKQRYRTCQNNHRDLRTEGVTYTM
jgi:hypothetical protein